MRNIAEALGYYTGAPDQTWGKRELYVIDADGNALRFVQPNISFREKANYQQER